MKLIVVLVGLGVSILGSVKCENLPSPNRKLDMIWSSSVKTLVGEFRSVELIVLDIRVPVIRCVIVENSDRSEYTLYWPRNVYEHDSSQIVIHGRSFRAASDKDDYSKIEQLFDSLWKTEPDADTAGGLDGFTFILRRYSVDDVNELRWSKLSGALSILEKEIIQFSRDFEVFNGVSPIVK